MSSLRLQPGCIKMAGPGIEQKRGKRITRFIEGKGLLYAVTFGPLLLGTDRKRMMMYSLNSSRNGWTMSPG